MRCSRHAACNDGKSSGCLFVRTGAPSVEQDLRHRDYAKMAEHIEPGITQRIGVWTHGTYQRFLKRHGMTDDVTLKEHRALVTDTGKRERIREEGIRRMTDRLAESMRRARQQPFRVQTPAQRQLMQRLKAYLGSHRR